MSIVKTCVLLLIMYLPAARAEVIIETVSVGDIGNEGELSGDEYNHYPRICGAVDYPYRIGKYEVTSSQFTEFLNTVPLRSGLWDVKMEGEYGSVRRLGELGNYTYEVIPGRENMPANGISYDTAARFANWLHNGQGDGDTETGAYAFVPGEWVSRRQDGWQWAVASDDEWYKAAYYDGNGSYHEYPTQSETPPTAESPPGGPNSANYGWIVDDVVEVGSYVDSPSHYGTFDQGGNVWEWTDTDEGGGVLHVARGGSFGPLGSSYIRLSAAYREPLSRGHAYNYSEGIGFRVVNHIPEPSTIALLVIGVLALLWWRFGNG